jgi:hypothetical protein
MDGARPKRSAHGSSARGFFLGEKSSVNRSVACRFHVRRSCSRDAGEFHFLVGVLQFPPRIHHRRNRFEQRRLTFNQIGVFDLKIRTVAKCMPVLPRNPRPFFYVHHFSAER